MSDFSVSSSFTCKCGMDGWVTEGEVMKDACPKCGRKYKGVYNSKKLGVEAVEVGMTARKNWLARLICGLAGEVK